MPEAIDDLTTNLGFNVDVSGLKKLRSTGIKVGASLGAIAIGGIAAQNAVGRLIGTLGPVDIMTKWARGLGIAANEAERFAGAMELRGVGQEQAIGLLRTLSQIREVAGREGHPLMEFVDFFDDAGNLVPLMTLLQRFADAFPGAQFPARMAGMVGLDEGIARDAFRAGWEPIAADMKSIQAENIGLTDEQREAAERYASATFELSRAMDEFAKEWKTLFVGPFEAMTETLAELVRFLTPEAGGKIEKALEADVVATPTDAANLMAARGGAGAVSLGEQDLYRAMFRDLREILFGGGEEGAGGPPVVQQIGEVHLHGLPVEEALEDVGRMVPETTRSPMGRR